MIGSWTSVSEDAGTVSLHDCRLDRAERRDADLVLHFADGFDVTRDNALNSTGRHRRTGPAAVCLKNWRYLGGAWGRGTEEVFPGGQRVPLPETPIPAEQFLSGLAWEILGFEWKDCVFTLLADGWTADLPASGCGFCEIALGGDQLLFCWDGLPQDAWFQDGPEK